MTGAGSPVFGDTGTVWEYKKKKKKGKEEESFLLLHARRGRGSAAGPGQRHWVIMDTGFCGEGPQPQ